MRKLFIILCFGALLLSSACTRGKYPLEPEQIDSEPTKKPDENPGNPPDFSNIKISTAFDEDFESGKPDFMELGRRVGAPDFRFYPDYPSFTEKSARHLMLRVDPQDGEGMMNGIKISSKECTYHGTYSFRFCAPDIAKVQSNAGLIASVSVLAEYDNPGVSEVAMEWRLADPAKVYLYLQSGSNKMEKAVTPNTSYSAAKSLVEYGFNWDETSVTWWMMSGSSKVELYKHTLDKNIILGPGCCRFCYYYSSDKPAEGLNNSTSAPKYPYELELDYISYKPAK